MPHQHQNSVSVKNSIAIVNSDLKNKYNAKSNEINNCHTQAQNPILLNDSFVARSATANGIRQISHSGLQKKDQPIPNAIFNTINNSANTNNNNIINNTKRPSSHYSDQYTAYTPLPSTSPSSDYKGIKHFGSIKNNQSGSSNNSNR